MAERLYYVSRLVHLPLIGADEAEIGRIDDVVLGAAPPQQAPPVHGFVVDVQSRRVFVSGNRVVELAVDGARLRRGSINMRHFELRPDEMLIAGAVIGRRVRDSAVVDVSIRPTPEETYAWEVATAALGRWGFLGRPRTQRVVEWTEVSEVFATEDPLARQAAAITQLHPAEMAEVISGLPPDRRRLLAGALQDERLAELLAEIPEDEQIRIVEGLDLGRAGRVLNEMEANDVADLLGELPSARRDQLLDAMDPDDADPVRRLLTYNANTAGGLMTPEPVIMPPTATVAEALARIRDPDLPAALAAQVFVTAPPHETPTGRYLGLVGYQRLLRELPTRPLGRCLDEHPEPLAADVPAPTVAARVAAYDVVAVPVIDAAGRLVGAVTVDDVLAHVLPPQWQRR
jgi:CBS domain-containing protein